MIEIRRFIEHSLVYFDGDFYKVLIIATIGLLVYSGIVFFLCKRKNISITGTITWIFAGIIADIFIFNGLAILILVYLFFSKPKNLKKLKKK